MLTKEIKNKLWNQGRSSGELPKDWIVIPVLDVIKILEEENAN
jgi:hypothetical protein